MATKEQETLTELKVKIKDELKIIKKTKPKIPLFYIPGKTESGFSKFIILSRQLIVLEEQINGGKPDNVRSLEIIKRAINKASRRGDFIP